MSSGTQSINECTVPLCDSNRKLKRKSAGGTLSFHEFPSDSKLKDLWIQNISRHCSKNLKNSTKSWRPSERSAVCGLHFLPESYVRGLQRKRLKKDAVPTQFPPFQVSFGINSEIVWIKNEADLDYILPENENLDENEIDLNTDTDTDPLQLQTTLDQNLEPNQNRNGSHCFTPTANSDSDEEKDERDPFSDTSSPLTISQSQDLVFVPIPIPSNSPDGSQLSQENGTIKLAQICQTCGQLISVSELMKHVASHVEPGPGICTLCNYAAGNKQVLVDHLSTHYNIKAYACAYCSKAYHWRHSLVRHFVNAHRKTESTKIQPEDSKSFRKKKAFNFKAQRMMRLRLRSARKINKVKSVSHSTNRICNQTSKFEKKPKRKKSHTNRIESDLGKTISTCKTCGEVMTFTQLFAHVRSHITSTQRECDLCGSVYANVDPLREHMNTHYGFEPHRCRICGLTYSLKQSAVNHIVRNHKVARASENVFCTMPLPITPKVPKEDSSSPRPSLVRARFQKAVRLVRKNPVTNKFQCNFCPMVFTTKFSVQRHEAKLHKNTDTDSSQANKSTHAPNVTKTKRMKNQSSYESSDNPLPHIGQCALKNQAQQTQPDFRCVTSHPNDARFSSTPGGLEQQDAPVRERDINCSCVMCQPSQTSGSDDMYNQIDYMDMETVDAHQNETEDIDAIGVEYDIRSETFIEIKTETDENYFFHDENLELVQVKDEVGDEL